MSEPRATSEVLMSGSERLYALKLLAIEFPITSIFYLAKP